jgi:hypothetical protein
MIVVVDGTMYRAATRYLPKMLHTCALFEELVQGCLHAGA